MKLYLKDIVDNIALGNLPAKWQGFDFARFSKDKTLFDFQGDALRNALKGIYRYFVDYEADKKRFFNQYNFKENFDYNLNRERKAAKYLLEYPEDYPIVDNKISFAYFINRMSFWMATGSGKTLIIVKLIELLGKLIAEKELPTRDILFLTHRDDLLDQFKDHVEEFNSFNFDTKINLKNLRDYESVKRENALPFAKNEITVFYYRSDLISDEHKEKIVNFRNYDNSGKWYILLDEAHKGDKEDSKRQILYSILSRNGFLFNFSATFTDPRDFATCAFRFNLADFIQGGYGKHIYLSSVEIAAFRNRDDFSPIEKQKIVLKSLILLTYIHKYFEKIRRQRESLYHRPLLLALVNSVNKPDADLQLFFREIEKVAKNEIRVDLLNQAKQELIKEFREHSQYQFEEDLEFVFDEKEFEKIKYEDVLAHVFNAKKPGQIEISFRPSDKSQVAFKLVPSDKYFALIKTGDMPQWLKDELNRFNINHRFENEGFFETLNRDDSDINVLMGSRSFYEGWDSNRPNLILFVNIGVGSDAKKFVLQSVGRGVRIEPQKYQRKRLQNLFNAKEVKEQLFEKVKNLILPIESLFVFGTNANNLKEIIATLKSQETTKKLKGAFQINPEAKKYLLLIPVYKETDKLLAEETDIAPFRISKSDFELTKSYFNYIGAKIALVKYDCEPKVLKSIDGSFGNEFNIRYALNNDELLGEPELFLGQIAKFLGLKMRKLEGFKKLEKEIIHFEEVQFRDGDRYKDIMGKIQQVRNYGQKEEKIKQLRLDFDRHKDLKKYDQEREIIDRNYVKEAQFEYETKKVKIKYLANHYYLPVILSESERVDYLNHIISVKSERDFLEELEEYSQRKDSIFRDFDWWMFSKLDQTLDKVGIVYYNQNEERITDFTPDFIFWMQKGNKYMILFVDPHGTAFRDVDLKIDWFERIFNQKEYNYPPEKGTMKIKVKLFFKPARGGTIGISEKYRKYWFDSFVDFADKIS